MTFKYTAIDPKTNQKTSDTMQAANEPAAAEALKGRGLMPLELKLLDQEKGLARWRHRISTKEKVIFSRQLSTLINAGLPLVQSLRTVAEQLKNPKFKGIISEVIASVEGGSTFSAALARHPNAFNNVYISLIAAGETSGTLDVSLTRLADQQEKDAEIMSKVRGALVYPFIVLAVMGGVMTFMITTVLPQVQSLYNELPGAQLPLVTRLLLGVSHFFVHFWWALVLLLVGGGYLLRNWARTEHGRATVDRLKLRLPLAGQLYMKLYMARFARVSSTLLASGVPLLKMLEVSAEAVGNVGVAASLAKASESVKGGKALSASLRGDPYFTELVPDMIRIGEQSGALEGMLDKVADYYEKEVDNQVKAISTIVEPVLMIFIGIIALVIVAAVLLPIYSLVGKNFIK